MITELPLWLAILVSALVVTGALLTMAGCLGLLRLKTFYLRIHSPTMGTSMGGGLILLSSAIFFSVTGGRLVVHEMAIFAFMTVTTPVTLMLLARASLFRDRTEGTPGIPGRPVRTAAPEEAPTPAAAEPGTPG